jgi:lysozyme
MSRRLVPILGALAILLVVPLVLFIYYQNYEPDRKIYELRGIDISHHQGRIDWLRVAKDDVAFALIKATEGGDHTDREYAANILAAEKAGIKVGPYHFFTFCRSGREQAEHFLVIIEGYPSSLLPALDLEFGGNCGLQPTPADLEYEIDTFLNTVESHLNRPMLLYVTPEFLSAYGSLLPSRPLWVRSIAWEPSNAQWSFWQYHNAGAVDGINGPVDLNVFCGDDEQLARFMALSRSAAPDIGNICATKR